MKGLFIVYLFINLFDAGVDIGNSLAFAREQRKFRPGEQQRLYAVQRLSAC
jgi:hypothetical protein